jgi:hypothetical protein
MFATEPQNQIDRCTSKHQYDTKLGADTAHEQQWARQDQLEPDRALQPTVINGWN